MPMPETRPRPAAGLRPRYRRHPEPPVERLRPSRARVWTPTIAVLVAYGLAVAVVREAWFAESVPHAVVSTLLALAAVHLAVIALVLGVLVVRKARRSSRGRKVGRVEPLARVLVARHLGGRDERDELVRVGDREPEAVERVVADLLGSISGSELRRLAELAEDLGLIDRWRREFRGGSVEVRRRMVDRLGRLGGRREAVLHEALDDAHPSVRIEAARTLIRGGTPAEVERVFELATVECLLVRAALVGNLRPHAIALGEQAIPRVLASARPKRIEVALEMIEAWGKSVPMPGIGALLRHPRPGVRARAIRILPYVVAADIDREREVLLALDDVDREPRIAAAAMAGRLRVERAVPTLLEHLHDPHRSVAVAAAHALAEVGPEGWTALERVARPDGGRAGSAALEALDRVRTSRLHLLARA